MKKKNRNEKDVFLEFNKKERRRKNVALRSLKTNEKRDFLKKKFTSVRDIGFSETQNSDYRKEMEDGHCILDGFRGGSNELYIGVYDGHGGTSCVEFVEKNLHKNFERALSGSRNVRDAFSFSYRKTDFDACKNLKNRQCGTTSVTCYMRTERHSTSKKRKTSKKESDPSERKEETIVKKLYTANCGDARAVLCRKNQKAQRLSYDHKAIDEKEVHRIEEMNGIVIDGRVSAVLAISRSFGDSDFKKWVVPDPFVSEVTLNDGDDFLIVACDGVWDVLSDQEAVDLVKHEQNAQKMADLLVETSLDKGSMDNISVCVVIL